MTAGTMFLKIITPERIVLEAPVKKITARAVDGELTILPGHEPIVTALAIDIVEFQGESSFDTAAVIGGVMEVKKGEEGLSDTKLTGYTTHGDKDKGQDNFDPDATYVTIVSNLAELDTEIDEARARQAKDRYEAEKTQKTDKLEVQMAEMALSRAMARLKATELTKRRKGGHNR
jgi:F-type H+-transporting ATPase subunit epsilon